jgi:hypothetical protein
VFQEVSITSALLYVNVIIIIFLLLYVAGGYDAIFVILLGTNAMKRVENLWQTWSSDSKNGVR